MEKMFLNEYAVVSTMAMYGIVPDKIIKMDNKPIAVVIYDGNSAISKIDNVFNKYLLSTANAYMVHEDNPGRIVYISDSWAGLAYDMAECHREHKWIKDPHTTGATENDIRAFEIIDKEIINPFWDR